jgi:catechol 2,3-dioxygenase-like lactoylglutathione lyase family enzyme
MEQQPPAGSLRPDIAVTHILVVTDPARSRDFWVNVLGAERLGLLPYMAILLELSPPGHVDATLNQGDTGRPGVAEQMLADAGLEFVDRGTAEAISEWPDLDLAARALASAGPSWPAVQSAGYDRFAAAVREALRPLCTDGAGVRAVSEFGWVVGRVPGA